MKSLKMLAGVVCMCLLSSAQVPEVRPQVVGRAVQEGQVTVVYLAPRFATANGVVYGVPLRPHLDATALALAALRFHYHLPTVNSSLTWMLNRIDCPSAYSLAWLILSAAAYKDWRPDVLPVLDVARDRLAALVEEPQQIQDTSTIALAALALDPETANNPLEVRPCTH